MYIGADRANLADIGDEVEGQKFEGVRGPPCCASDLLLHLNRCCNATHAFGAEKIFGSPFPCFCKWSVPWVHATQWTSLDTIISPSRSLPVLVACISGLAVSFHLSGHIRSDENEALLSYMYCLDSSACWPSSLILLSLIEYERDLYICGPILLSVSLSKRRLRELLLARSSFAEMAES
jgi:hypothetical protein